MESTQNKKFTPLVVILLGAPGSGKGTQAKELGKALRIPHISTGDLFRENLSQNTELGKKVKSFMESGKLVPDSLVLDMLFDRVKKPDCRMGYLLDGFPRTIPQAEALEESLYNKAKTLVLNLNVNDKSIINRITGRLTCSKCGNLHNKFFSPPKNDGKCDACGSDLIQRADDKLEIIEERLKVYHDQTEPLVSFYKERDVLHTVDGEMSPDKVFGELMKVCEQRCSLN